MQGLNDCILSVQVYKFNIVEVVGQGESVRLGIGALFLNI
jgi:hypothetical protein